MEKVYVRIFSISHSYMHVYEIKKSAFKYEFVQMEWDNHCYNKTDPKNNSQLWCY